MTAIETLVRGLVANAAVAAVLALVVAVVSRRLRWPAAVHLLWLAVLARMVMPPLLPVSLLPTSARPGDGLVAVTGAVLRPVTDAAVPLIDPWLALTMAWSAGVAAVLAVAAIRTRRLRRLMGQTVPAPASLIDRVEALADRFGISPPRTLVVHGRLPPMLWGRPGRPTIIVPARLAGELDGQRLETLLAHELAHVARRDHWVRWLELAVTIVCWWNPITWWARHHLRRAEERSADQLVSRLLPDHTRAYADTLVATLRFLAGIRLPATVGAVGMADLSEVQRRLEMIMSHRVPRRWSVLARFALVTVVAATLAVSPQLRADSENEKPEFRGEPITLQLYRADLGDVLLAFGQLTDHPVFIEPGITGSVTIDVTDTPWNVVLDQILSERGLGWIIDDDGTIKVYRSGPVPAVPILTGPLKGSEVFRFVDGVFGAPKRIAGPSPVYPEDARLEKVSGVVVLETVIDERGRVADVMVVRSPDNRLSTAALDAVRDWVFEPAILEGSPVAVRYVLTVAFRLE